MYSGILRRRTDACFATLLPIFEDVMESATFGHDRLEILSIPAHMCECTSRRNGILNNTKMSLTNYYRLTIYDTYMLFLFSLILNLMPTGFQY